MGFLDKLQHNWNLFLNKDPTNVSNDTGPGYSYRPDRMFYGRFANNKSIVSSIFCRIAIDVAQIDIKHCKLDENERYVSTISSNLNECLTLEANLDQTARALKQDIVMSMLEEGVVAIVPIETKLNPKKCSIHVVSMRVGEVLEWKPKHVKVRVYNEEKGKKEDVVVPKSTVCLIENPLYAIINEPNGTLQRLKRKLSLLDVADENTASGKLDMIIQLPYLVRTPTKKAQAEARRKDIEMQLTSSTYGIAYTDGTEKITQLNRPLENNLQARVEYLTKELFAQLGITEEILNGTADEKTMLNYYSRTIEPITSAIVDEMKRKFLTKTARTQGQTILSFRDPFKLVPVNNIAEIADKFTRNEIMTSNEIRQVIGMKPSKDPKADQLINSNISQPNERMEELGVNGNSPSGSFMDSTVDQLE